MHRTRLLTINGTTKHIKEWAMLHNIPYNLVESRWDKGVRDVLTLFGPKKENIKLTYKGRTETLKNWSHITGIKYDTLHARYRRDRTPESILSPWSQYEAPKHPINKA